MLTIRKKTAVRLITFICAAFAVLGGFLIQARGETTGADRYIRVSYRRAFSDLVSNMDDLDSALQKSRYATSQAVTAGICTEIFGKAMAAQSALSALPFASYELERTSSFISKAGDYAYSLARSAGSTPDSETLDNLAALSESASALAQDLRELYTRVDEGAVSIGRLKKAQDDLAQQEDGDAPGDLAGNFRQMEDELGDIPSLIYDGPFSSHIADRKPALLDGLDEVDETAALETAASFLGVGTDDLRVTGRRESPFPVYLIAGAGEDTDLSAEISCAGGKMVFFERRGAVDGQRLDDESACAAAEAYLAENGFDGLRATYAGYNGSAVTVNCAFEQDGTLCYPDLVKVTLAPDGTAVGLDCLGYVSNHTARDLIPEPVDESEARSQVADSLTVLQHQMAVIPTPGKNEVYCHEFLCENEDKQQYLVYVNAETGLEENILILLIDENGTLTV